jgi:hypothetical protein
MFRIPSVQRRAAHPLSLAWLASAFLLALMLLLATRPAHAADGDDKGARQLLITYRSEARDRPAFRAYLAGEGRAPLDKLVKNGALKDYVILFNPFNSSFTWDAMLVLNFNRSADVAQWMALERGAPGGLDTKGLKLARPVDTYWADLAWAGGNPGNNKDSIYYVIPYDYANAAEYRKYMAAYVLPQVEGWLKDGALTSYRFYMNRSPVGKPWDSLFVYQYRDLESFGRRDEVVAKVREGLKNDPVWQKLNETKSSIRTESENTVAQAVQPR